MIKDTPLKKYHDSFKKLIISQKDDHFSLWEMG